MSLIENLEASIIALIAAINSSRVPNLLRCQSRDLRRMETKWKVSSFSERTRLQLEDLSPNKNQRYATCWQIHSNDEPGNVCERKSRGAIDFVDSFSPTEGRSAVVLDHWRRLSQRELQMSPISIQYRGERHGARRR
jgi:hypothetical protein